jgi:hypothetical protein
VRREGTLARAASQDQRASGSARRDPRAAYRPAPRVADPHRQYVIWTDYAVLASTFLLVVAWIDLVAGAVVTLVLLLTGEGLAGLIWLLVTGAGFAMPFCLAALTRMVVYRFRIDDRSVPAQ